jgi:hypothetical protein
MEEVINFNKITMSKISVHCVSLKISYFCEPKQLLLIKDKKLQIIFVLSLLATSAFERLRISSGILSRIITHSCVYRAFCASQWATLFASCLTCWNLHPGNMLLTPRFLRWFLPIFFKRLGLRGGMTPRYFLLREKNISLVGLETIEISGLPLHNDIITRERATWVGLRYILWHGTWERIFF